MLIVKQPGSQRKLTDEQETELLSVISTRTLEDAGLGVSANWTAALACAFVKQKYSSHSAAAECSTCLTSWGLVTPGQHTHWTRLIPKSRSSSEKRLKHKKNCWKVRLPQSCLKMKP